MPGVHTSKSKSTPDTGESGGSTGGGVGVDKFGGSVIDPTKNVLDLVDMSVTRLNDLRLASLELMNAKLAHVKEIGELRGSCAKEMRDADTRLGDMREKHAEQLRALDSDRLEKIRQVDVLAGNTAADRALVAIQTLATTQSAAAETLRAMVASTATTIATQLDQRMAAVTERIMALEKTAYTGQGKATVSDPMMSELITEMKRVVNTQSGSAGKATIADPMLAEMLAEMKMTRAQQATSAGVSEGKGSMWGYIAGGVGFLLTLVGLASAIIAFANK